MFDLEKAIRHWRQILRKNEALEDGYIAELESHLRDEIEHQQSLGLTEQKAFDKATEGLGQVDMLGTEFYKSHTRRLTGRPPWKTPRFMPDLIWNYFKIALRKIRRQKGYSFINVVGLAIGMACVFIILLWIQDELSYDRFHEHRDFLYRVAAFVSLSNWSGHTVTGPPPLAPALKEAYPEIVNATRFDDCPRVAFKHGEKAFYEEKGVLVDPSFFDMFTFPFIKGNPETALSDPYSIILTEKTAAKYFGQENPLFKTLLGDGRLLMTVTGVLKDIPENSHIQFDYVLPFELKKELGSQLDYWGNSNSFAYVQLHEQAIPSEVDKKISNFLSLKLASVFKLEKAPDIKTYLQPLDKIHLDSQIQDQEYAEVSDKKYVYVFSVIAFFVLIIACINFMNLFTARSLKRAKEIALRKVVGSKRTQIIKQFFTESILFSFLSLLIALVSVHSSLPFLNRFLGKTLTLNLLDFRSLFGLLLITLMTGVLAGIYPALFLSSFSPVRIMRGTDQKGGGHSSMRKFLVVAQFSLSIILIIGTCVVYRQLNYMKTFKLGFDKENVVFMPLKGNIGKHYETFKNDLLQEASILSVTAKNSHPLEESDYTTDIEWPGKDPSQNIIMEATGVDFDYIETMRLDVKEGRSFSREYKTDINQAFILNEKAVRLMGLESPVGKEISVWNEKGTVIGVVKNAHFRSLRYQVEPQILYLYPDLDTREMNEYGVILVRIKGGYVPEALASIERVWKDMAPDFPFEFGFLDQSVDSQYRNEKQTSQIINIFTLLALFVSCLGLFGLASFMAEQRTKEIGVRKVLGASVSQVVIMLSTEFAKWVFMACIIAWPTAYIILKKWLHEFAYKVNLGVEIFLFSTMFALIIALLTVSYQAIKAAVANPVDSLRYE